jgi:putative serine protease PepD
MLEPGSDPASGPLPPSIPRRELRRWPFVVVALLSGLVAAAATAGGLYAAGAFDDEAVTTTATTVTPTTPPVGTEVDAAAVGRKVVPSIVTVQIGTEGPAGFDLFGSGSGVVLSADGLIVTNHHVIADSDLARVVFQDGRIYSAEVVGSDPRTDLAVLSITAGDLIPIELGATDTMEIGEAAIAVGNPLGLAGGASLTMGVLSAFEREVVTGNGSDPNDRLFGMLQTDAPIQQGSSGGALVDSAGRLIGITTAVGLSSAGAEGIGFAIPVELVSRVTDQIIETGAVRHAFLGVSLQNAYQDAADGAQAPAGALISGFADDTSAAEAAGLEIGDVIVAYNGIAVGTREQLISALHRLEVDDVVTLEVTRGAERRTFDVVLAERPLDQ